MFFSSVFNTLSFGVVNFALSVALFENNPLKAPDWLFKISSQSDAGSESTPSERVNLS